MTTNDLPGMWDRSDFEYGATDAGDLRRRVWGACGVEDCRDCWPLFNEANEPVTDNFGRPL